MEKWLVTLEEALLKKFNQDEVDIVVDYYREMITERIEHDEKLEDILANYHIKTIEKEMMVDRLSKSINKTSKEFIKNLLQFFFILITTPLWIPFAIVYFILFIVIGVLLIIAGSIFVAGILSAIYLVIQAFGQDLVLLEIFGYIGRIFISFTFLSFLSIGIYKVCQYTAKYLYIVFIKLVKKER